MLKRILVTVALIGVTAASFGQGTVVFDNKNISTGQAPVTRDGTTNRVSGAVGPSIVAQLYSASGIGAAESSLTAVENRVSFRGGINAGFVLISGTDAVTGLTVDPEVTVTPVANGPATVQMRAWDAAFPTYAAAEAALARIGKSNPINIAATGGGLLPAVELAGLQGFDVSAVPEPSTLAFGALGLAAFLFRRRK